MIITLFIILMISSVNADSQWDRPLVIFNITPFVVNFTNNLEYLDSKIDNETINRVLNDSYLQSQINVTKINITQLFSITTIYGINISQLTNDIYNINNDISIINSNITYIYELIENLNDTLYIVNSTIKQPSEKYLSYNSSNFYINESVLNITINNISQNKKYLYITSINVTSGSGFMITNISIRYLLTRITINGMSIYRSECVESTSGNIIDKDRIPHNKVFDIEKNYAIDGMINCTITNANTDGIYNITITYINNGFE